MSRAATPFTVPGWLERGRSAVSRRARHWWQTATRGERAPAAEAALPALAKLATDDGLSPTAGGAACPGLTAAAIPTLWRLGVDELPLRWAHRLMRLQRPDGALPDAGLKHPSLFNTAQAAQAFAVLAADGALVEATDARRHACAFLTGRIGTDGRVRAAEAGGAFERWAPAAVRLAGLAGVVEAADPRRRPAVATLVRRAVELVLRTSDVIRCDASLHVVLHGIEALLDLEGLEPQAGGAARTFLRRAAERQRRDGSVPADEAHRWTSSAGLAHLAGLWYRVGCKSAADRALACLRARQNADGAWTGSWGRGAAYFPNSPSTWTLKFALDALAAQVRAAFADVEPSLVTPPTDDDGRLCAVVELVAELPKNANVVDVGCGSGRYLRRLHEHFPSLQTTGIDPAGAMLAGAPPQTRRLLGDLHRLPTAAGEYDAAYCIEALEHALVPQRAVAELCRIVRPGGRVLIIDKDRRFQALSHHEPWERWFDPASVAGWLAEFCDDVRCRPLPPGPHQRKPGLFLCWQGVRKAATSVAVTRRAA